MTPDAYDIRIRAPARMLTAAHDDGSPSLLTATLAATWSWWRPSDFVGYLMSVEEWGLVPGSSTPFNIDVDAKAPLLPQLKPAIEQAVGDAEGTWEFTSIRDGSGTAGVRIILPPSARTNEPVVMNEDGVISPRYHLEPAPDLDGTQTWWLVTDGGLGCQIVCGTNLDRGSRLTLGLGPTLFGEVVEPSMVDVVTPSGATHTEWLNVNKVIVDMLMRDLRALGWTFKHSPIR